jgi:hypothetical protein
MLAFVIPAGRDSHDTLCEVKLAYLLKNLKSSDKEFSCDVFKAVTADALKYDIESKNQVI